MKFKLHSKIKFVFAASLISSITNVNAENIKVIVNADKNIEQLAKQEIRNLFMGGVTDHELTPVSLSEGNISRKFFHTKVIGLTESRIQSYWAQMRFSGRLSEPKEVESDSEALKCVREKPDCVAYVAFDFEVPEDVKVVYVN